MAFDFTNEEFRKIWLARYGDVDFAQDCFGTWICRNDYKNPKPILRVRPGTKKPKDYRPDCDHIYPESLGGLTTLLNLEIMSFRNNRKKGNKLQFKIKMCLFNITERNHNLDGFGIYNITTKKFVDWISKNNNKK